MPSIWESALGADVVRLVMEKLTKEKRQAIITLNEWVLQESLQRELERGWLVKDVVEMSTGEAGKRFLVLLEKEA